MSSGCLGCGMNSASTNCRGRGCGGRCYGFCPSGSTCKANQYGIYRCVVNPTPWYQTWWGILLLVLAGLIFILLIIGMIWWIRRSKAAVEYPSTTIVTGYPQIG